MNCPECGHPKKNHDIDAGCTHPSYGESHGERIYCLCTLSEVDIELAAWKAEALAAREWIDYLYKNRIWGMDESELEGHENHYLAARVKDA